MNARTPPGRHGPPWLRLGLAAAAVAGCALAGLGTRCDDMPGTDLVALLGVVAIQGMTALASLAMLVVACARRDFGRAGVEAVVGVGMLLVVPLAVWALVSVMPDCSPPWTGG